MESPKSTTKRKSGSQETIASIEVKPSGPSAQVPWKTSTSRPYAALADNRLSRIEVSATTTERHLQVRAALLQRGEERVALGPVRQVGQRRPDGRPLTGRGLDRDGVGGAVAR